ncbi:MAG TPA: hypothetical protein VF742_02675 [Terracidiphilus sp.]
MPKRFIPSIFTLFTISLVSASIALAQSTTSPDAPVATNVFPWQVAKSNRTSGRKLYVVTIDQPSRRQTCRVQSFTEEELVCSRAIGGSRTYLPQQVAALILPGDGHLKLWLMLGFNGGLGAAIWGTVVLAATCPLCAAGTAVAAFFFFDAAGAVLIGDDQPDQLLYLAPGQHLSGRLSKLSLVYSK